LFYYYGDYSIIYFLLRERERDETNLPFIFFKEERGEREREKERINRLIFYIFLKRKKKKKEKKGLNTLAPSFTRGLKQILVI
jgi:hypothetical protein